MYRPTCGWFASPRKGERIAGERGKEQRIANSEWRMEKDGE
jgi:hypothetical protein